MVHGRCVPSARAVRVGCYKTALRSVLGFHVADFPLFQNQIVKLAAHA